MRRHVGSFALLCLLVLLVVLAPAPASAQGPARGGASQGIVVTLDSPSPFKPAYGEVEIVAVVVADETVERVAFYVDDVVMGELREPPYRLTVDLGPDNVEHRFQVVAYGASGATGSNGLATPAIRIDEEVSVALQQLYVTVSKGGQRIKDLGREEFQVLEEGRPQRLITFARGDIPFTGLVLLDSSVSMQGAKLRSALRGARAFFTGMRPLDEGKLLVFSDRILHITPFTTFPEVLTAGLSQVEARGGTALNDHLYLALKQLEQRQGRRVVVLLSDGVDSHSVLTMADVAAKARRSQALVYWLRLPYRGNFESDDGALPGIASAWRSSDDYRREYQLLEQTVLESGGRIQALRSLGEIESAFQGILEELRDQYVLGYYPPRSQRDGQWHPVRVRLGNPELEVRCREGYLDF